MKKNSHTRETEWRRIHTQGSEEEYTHKGEKKNTHTRETEWRRIHTQGSEEEYTHKGYGVEKKTHTK